MKANYLAGIQEAGFEEVDILAENSFPLQCMANDATAQVIIENAKLPSEIIQEVGNSIVSIKVLGLSCGFTKSDARWSINRFHVASLRRAVLHTLYIIVFYESHGRMYAISGV